MPRITRTQRQDYQISPRDRKGNPAKLDGAAKWTSSDENVATVDQSESGLTATVTARGTGVATITVEADADLGEGIRSLAGSVELEVTEAEAIDIGLTEGEASEQPDDQ